MKLTWGINGEFKIADKLRGSRREISKDLENTQRRHRKQLTCPRYGNPDSTCPGHFFSSRNHLSNVVVRLDSVRQIIFVNMINGSVVELLKNASQVQDTCMTWTMVLWPGLSKYFVRVKFVKPSFVPRPSRCNVFDRLTVRLFYQKALQVGERERTGRSLPPP